MCERVRVCVCVYNGHMGPQCISRPVVMRYEASAGSQRSCGGGQGQLSDLLTVLTNSINVNANAVWSHGCVAECVN